MLIIYIFPCSVGEKNSSSSFRSSASNPNHDQNTFPWNTYYFTGLEATVFERFKQRKIGRRRIIQVEGLKFKKDYVN